jgi:hypothetical protein
MISRNSIDTSSVPFLFQAPVENQRLIDDHRGTLLRVVEVVATTDLVIAEEHQETFGARAGGTVGSQVCFPSTIVCARADQS